MIDANAQFRKRHMVPPPPENGKWIDKAKWCLLVAHFEREGAHFRHLIEDISEYLKHGSSQYVETWYVSGIFSQWSREYHDNELAAQSWIQLSDG